MGKERVEQKGVTAEYVTMILILLYLLTYIDKMKFSLPKIVLAANGKN